MVTKSLGNFGKVKIDLTKLNKIEQELNTYYSAQVGILGAKSKGRKNTVVTKSGKRIRGKADSSQTNAEIGLLHEKGSKSRNIPRRSFLEVPISIMFPKFMNKIGERLIENLTTENLKQTYQKIALIGEHIVLKAFNTKGYGKWAPNSPATIRRKGSSMPLIDTAQLRKSVSSRVVKRK